MSALIDIDMPEECIDCPLESYHECLVTGKGSASVGRASWCPFHEVPDESDIPIYDKETRHENCTVQILENTKTGKISIGWWENEK